MNIVIIEQGKDTYTAFGEKAGFQMGTTIRKKAYKEEVERVVIERFNSQFHVLKQAGANIPTTHKKTKHNITWLTSADVVAFANNTFANNTFVANPVTNKPKIYEILENPNGGLTLVKHDKELLDEDEAKIKLFETAVNGGK